MMQKLVVATHNQGKVREYADMLQEFAVAWLSLSDTAVTLDVEETGQTFTENAVLKAQSYAAETGLLTMAEDSGLEVDALDGAPGVYTARYGGPGLSHAERYLLLLQRLQAVAWPQRTARFRCVIALADGEGRLLGTAEGVCEGMIALQPTGTGGFGYDPVFYVPEQQKTMAAVTAATKHQISHRGQALRAIMPLLRQTLQPLQPLA